MAADPGHLPPSNIQTDQSPYPFWALERWIRALVAFLIQVGLIGDGASTVVWRPGGVSLGNVFATWAEVVAAVAKLNGDITIGVDTDLGAAVIPAGNWDLRPPGVSGPVTMVRAGKNFLFEFVTVTTAAAAVTLHGLSGLDDVQFVNHSTVDLMTALAADNINFLLTGFAEVQQSVTAAGKAFINATTGNAAITLNDLSLISTLDGGSLALQDGAAGSVSIFVNDNAIFDTNQLLDAAGNSGAFLSANGIMNAQPGAPSNAPAGGIQFGTAPIVVGTGKTAAIPATIGLGPNTAIVVSLKTPVGDALTVKYAALNADRITGGPGVGSFKISALTAAGGGAVNGADTSTVSWLVKN